MGHKGSEAIEKWVITKDHSKMRSHGGTESMKLGHTMGYGVIKRILGHRIVQYKNVQTQRVRVRDRKAVLQELVPNSLSVC